MIEKIKYKLFYLAYFCVSKIMEYVFFIYEIIRHPIRKISVWFVALLFWIVYENIKVSMNGKEMFIMSAGLVSIMTFISSYLENQTIDMEKKENFYLGFNVKKLRFHDNVWLKRFNNVPLKLLFWLIAVVPVMILYAGIGYNTIVLCKIADFINKNIVYIKSAWLAVFVVSSFYCVAILIESVSLSRVTFSQSYLYRTSKRIEKDIIERKIKDYFKEEFKKVFSIKSILKQNNEFYSSVEILINYIFNRGRDVSNNETEFNEYVEWAFCSERDLIDNLLRWIFKYNENNKNNKFIGLIKSFLLEKSMEMLMLYYSVKWNTINSIKQCNVSTFGILEIAYYDLRKLLHVEEKMHSNDDYKNIFWGEYRKNGFQIYSKDVAKSNLCMSKIVNILEEKIKNIDFINNISDVDIIFNIFDVLNDIDCKTKGRLYFPRIFNNMYFHVIYDDKGCSNIVREFSNKIKSKYLEDYIVKEREVQSKKILMSGDILPKEKNEYLASFLPLKDIVSVLIFRLAYSERSHREVMNLEEFKVWKNAVYYREAQGEDIEELKNHNFILELCDTINKSYVSHFIFDDFLKWVWASLFEIFDDKKYKEFIELGKKGIRRDFYLNSYIVIRLLLCTYSYKTFSLYGFTDDDKEQIKNELSDIKDILNEERIHI